MPALPRSLSLLAIVAPLLLAGCASTAAPAGGASEGRVAVVASFYPLEFAARQIGGDHVTVSDLTKPGTEPHDVELSPKAVADLSRAALVIYARGFQPAVDTAVSQQAADHGFDVTTTARLDLEAPVEAGGSPQPAGAKDPHFWLDPTRYADVARALAVRLAEVDPPHAGDYARNAKVFTDALAALDAEFTAGTTSCRITDLVTSHAAFGYLASRYGFTQLPIAGLSPDVEPSAATLAEVSDLVRARRVTTIYSETLVEPRFAETVARNTGARLAVLDPVEGLTGASAGKDYFEVMRANLSTIRTGQACS